MNHYKNNFGVHTPQLTEQLANLLIAAGLTVEDHAYHNDELDRLSVPLNKDFDLMIWVGDPSHPEDYCQTNTIWKSHKTDSDLDINELFTGTFEEIVAKVKELTINETTK